MQKGFTNPQQLNAKPSLKASSQNDTSKQTEKHTGEVSISWKVLGMQQQMKFVL